MNWLDCLRPSYGRTLFERAYHARLASCLEPQIGGTRGTGQPSSPRLGALPKASPPASLEAKHENLQQYSESEVTGHHIYQVMRPTTAAGGVADAGYPVVVFLHGGAWVASDLHDPAGVHQAFLSDFVARGWTCINANYHLAGATPADIGRAVQDVGRLLEHLLVADVAGAARRGVILMGHSAGAHLALHGALTALSADVARHLRGVVCLAGIYDVADFARRSSVFVRRFGPRGLLGASPDAMRALSPRFVRSDTLLCPVRLIHGAGEGFLLTQAQECVLTLQARKILASLSVLKQHDHFSVLAPSFLRADSAVPEICDFMSDCAATRIRSGTPKKRDAG